MLVTSGHYTVDNACGREGGGGGELEQNKIEHCN